MANIDTNNYPCPKCGGDVIMYSVNEITNNHTINKFIYFKCNECYEIYSGCEYRIIDGRIVGFRFIK